MKFTFKKVIVLSSIVLFSNSLFSKGLLLTSPDLQGQVSKNQVFNGFGCIGKNISPELKWNNAPKGTKSFAISIYDPDAPTGSGWWHWLAFDISKNTNHIVSNASSLNTLPKGTIQGKSDYGKNKFGGACPPKGDKSHAYITTIYALDVEKLGLDKNASSALTGYMLNAHTIEKSSIINYYQR